MLDPDFSHVGPDAAEVEPGGVPRAHRDAARAPLKARLLDQAQVAGIGNLLADEVLWRAQLSPRRPAGELSRTELDRLHRHLRKAITDAIHLGGVHTGRFVKAHRDATGTARAARPRSSAPRWAAGPPTGARREQDLTLKSRVRWPRSAESRRAEAFAQRQAGLPGCRFLTGRAPAHPVKKVLLATGVYVALLIPVGALAQDPTPTAEEPRPPTEPAVTETATEVATAIATESADRRPAETPTAAATDSPDRDGHRRRPPATPPRRPPARRRPSPTSTATPVAQPSPTPSPEGRQAGRAQDDTPGRGRLLEGCEDVKLPPGRQAALTLKHS